MAEAKDDPSTPSADYAAQSEFWHMVDAILCGVEALRQTNFDFGQQVGVPGPVQPYAHLQQLRQRMGISSESPYLPKFENESWNDYDRRRRVSPLTNIYADISSNLASKPFSRECQLDPNSPQDLEKLEENVDGEGNSLHVFASNTFKAGLDKGISWILIDYAKVPAGATLADERAMGARPYWVHIPAERLLAVYSDFIGGEQIIYHARICEDHTERSGYGETTTKRVRVFDRAPVKDVAFNDQGEPFEGPTVGYAPATWELYEYYEAEKQSDSEWQLVDGGPVTIGIIPMVPFIIGKRRGTTWQIEGPLAQLAHLQIEEFQNESNLKSIKELAAFPMLAGNGVEVPRDAGGQQMTVPVGPRAVLFAPLSGTGRPGRWEFIEPSATSLTFLQSNLDNLRTEMRNLGMQPLTTSNLTVVTTANVSAKAHNAVQAWALKLKDALEEAWRITCLWLGREEEPEVLVHTDFGVDFQADTELSVLAGLATGGKLSDRTLWEELKRRGVLSDDFDPDEEERQIAEQQQGLQPEQPIDPRTGQPLNLQTAQQIDVRTGRPPPK